MGELTLSLSHMQTMDDEVLRRQANVEMPISEPNFAAPGSGAYAPYPGVYAPQSYGSPAREVPCEVPYAAQPYGAQAPARGVFAQRYDAPAVDAPTATPLEAAPPDSVHTLPIILMLNTTCALRSP
jgi:hypothetical protein